jgi:hypothetical protein
VRAPSTKYIMRFGLLCTGLPPLSVSSDSSLRLALPQRPRRISESNAFSQPTSTQLSPGYTCDSNRSRKDNDPASAVSRDSAKLRCTTQRRPQPFPSAAARGDCGVQPAPAEWREAFAVGGVAAACGGPSHARQEFSEGGADILLTDSGSTLKKGLSH